MSFFNLLKMKLRAKEVPHPELVERKIPIVLGRYQVRVKDLGREMYLEDFLSEGRKPKNKLISRFYLADEQPWGLHFAPTLEKALDWFTGEKRPNDGYLSIAWGQYLTYICSFCKCNKTQSLKVRKVEKVLLSCNSPFHWEIEGYRVSEIETDIMGKGNPSKLIKCNKIYPIVKWHSGKYEFICQRCADRFEEIGREEEIVDYAIF
jgi:hypothetical protein